MRMGLPMGSQLTVCSEPPASQTDMLQIEIQSTELGAQQTAPQIAKKVVVGTLSLDHTDEPE